MTLSSGSKLGPYEIVAPLGAGGMGEVYRARDSKLSRDVALKVIPQAFAHDEQRMARFQREAQVLASLNHTHIASIYGFEESGGVRALVMELVEGPTLAERIKQGAIPIEEALPIAKQIAEALECAHERGIVHRDLKPANIKLTHDGKVKVLDFGLAKALLDGSSSQDISNSPTLTMASTKEGIILGTAAYMSPEQAKGKAVDRRSDIWSFGVVLFEMLTGEQTFGGETVSDALAAIIKDSPDWNSLPKSTPRAIRDLLQRCLQKDPRQRLQAIGDARIAIEEVLSGAVQDTASTSEVAASASLPAAQSWRRFVPWAIAAVLGVALFVSLFALREASQPSARRIVELSMSIPPDQQLDRGNGPAVVISPDGSRFVYATREGGSGAGRLYVREMDKSAALLLDGAGSAASPFFSPDSQWIGFFNDGKLKKISVRGGAAIALCDVAGFRGGAWGEDGTIIAPLQFTSALYRVRADGSKPELITHLDKARSETTHRWPQLLPGGKAVLFTASADNNFFGRAAVEAASLETGTPKLLVENAYFGRYLPGGYLAYVSQGTVFVVPFDAQGLKVTGAAIPVLQGVDADLSNGGAQISFSDGGAAVYLSGGALDRNPNVVLLDRKGNASVLMNDQPEAASPSLSPDGKRLAFQKTTGVWIHDLARGTTSPLNPGAAPAIFPVWTADGERLAYERPEGTGAAAVQGIYWKRSDGSGEEEALTPLRRNVNVAPSSWSPDGQTLAIYGFSEKDGSCCEMWTVTMNEKGKPQEPRRFPFQESSIENGILPRFSPDGHWVAYVSTELGIPQVYVVPFPGSGGKWQVSADGGSEPRWSKTGHEIFYVRGSSVIAVPYSVEKNSFQLGKPEKLFDGVELRAPFTSYDVMPDGQHFVMFQFAGGRSALLSQPTVVLNWFDEARKQVAAGQGDAGK
jgi:serine/threonine protein kinase/Tol biopolymer transport system component